MIRTYREEELRLRLVVAFNTMGGTIVLRSYRPAGFCFGTNV